MLFNYKKQKKMSDFEDIENKIMKMVNEHKRLYLQILYMLVNLLKIQLLSEGNIS